MGDTTTHIEDIKDVPEEERKTPPQPPGRVEVEDPEEKYGEPVFSNRTFEERIATEREIFGLTSNEDVIQQFANSLSAEQWEDVRKILQQMPVTRAETIIDPLIESEIAVSTVIAIGKYQTRKQYSRKMHGNYDAIMADARAEIEKQNRGNFLRWLKKAKKRDIKPITENAQGLYGDGLLNDDPETAVEWLSERCRLFSYALEDWDLPTDELTKLIQNRVASWYKRRYRQAKDAEGVVRKTDGRTPLPTHEDYGSAFNFDYSEAERGKAFLQQYGTDDLTPDAKERLGITNSSGVNFAFEDGHLFLAYTDEGGRRKRLLSAQLQDLRTRKNIENINTGYMKVIFGFIIHAKQINPETGTVWIYLPDLYFALTGKKDVPFDAYMCDEDGNEILDENGNRVISEKGKGFKTRLIETIEQNYQNVGGLIYEGGREPSIYPPLLFVGYDEPQNKIGFKSPYLDKLYSEMQKNRLTYQSTNSAGRTSELEKPMFSYLIDSTIYSEKNKIAVRNVEIIVNMIERAGVGVHETSISVETIIQRNALLQKKLENSKNITRDLERAFKKTFELLQTRTHLQDKYKDIKFPKHPEDTPTAKNYKTKVLKFKHKGLNRD